MRRLLALIAGMACAASAWGADGPSAPQESVSPPPLIRALQKTMTRQPVIGVGLPGLGSADTPTGSDPAMPLRERLRSIGEVASTGSYQLVPYAVGSAWVLAPDTREEFALPDQNAGPVEFMGRVPAMRCFLASLTPEQVRRLGSPGGLPARDVRGVARAALMRALRPPLAVSERRKPEELPPVEGEDKDSQWRDVRRLDAPLDFSRLRVFARLNLRDAEFAVGDSSWQLSVVPPPEGPALRPVATGLVVEPFNNLEMPPLAVVPNGYKPSDLSGHRHPALRRKIGLDGVRTVKEVVEAASRATGFSLHVIPMWKDVPVFLGSGDIPAGDVLDGLCLALEGAWRRLGGAYVLCWDRRGLAPLQQSLLESTAVVSGRADRMVDLALRAGAWILMARCLPFYEENPLFLTEEQRGIILPDEPSEDCDIDLDEMDPAQQDWLRTQAREQTISVRDENGQDYQRSLDPEEIETASICPNVEIVVSVEEPSIGRIWLGPDLGTVYLYGQNEIRQNGLSGAAKLFTVTAAMLNVPGAFQSPAQPEEDEADGSEEADETESGDRKPGVPGMPAIPSPVRAVMVPPLGPAMLNDLVESMRRHGFNMLFYPVLYDGYATMPSAAFGLHPSLRDKDGLQAAVSAVAGTDIRVVAYVNTLTWRSPDQPVHWLRNHPDWLERDLLGRCRSEWLSEHPLKDAQLNFDVAADRDYVCASVPEVASRLQVLLKEVSARPGLSGLALADWMSSFQTIDFSWGEGPDPKIQPPMGFTLADRRAFLLQKRLDPVDLTLWSDPRRLPRTLAGRPEELELWDINAEDSTWGMDMTDPEVNLVSSLLRAVRGLRPDWETYLFDYMGAYGILTGLEKDDLHPSGRSDRPRRKDVPAPNHTIGPILFAGEHADGVSIPLASRLIIDATLALGNPGDPRDFMDTLRKGEWREFPWGALLALSAQHFLQPGHAEQPVRYDPPRIFVLNFQRAPNIMFDVLRRFRPPTPEDLAPPKGAQVSGPGAAR